LNQGGIMREHTALALADATKMARSLRDKVGQAIFGQDELVNETICCLLAGGHILMTGAPGLAKTTLVRVVARNLGLNFGRVQFTPDLLPSDITGADILNVDLENGRRTFEFSPGPIFTNLLLADEINRASPRTQSALLEAMQERSVTIGGKMHKLTAPFMVFATQNPYESEGTFPLPEAQLDRFLVHTLVEYPPAEAEIKMLTVHAEDKLVGETMGRDGDNSTVLGADQVRQLIDKTKSIVVQPEIITGISKLVRSSRPDDPDCPPNMRASVWYGAGPRAGISLISVCRALAVLEESEVVRWRHVRRMAKPVLRHRIRLTAQALRDQVNEDAFIDQLLERLEAQQSNLAQGLL
jgi:MoxR-like ATPase